MAVLYQKYRPLVFAEVIGQDPIIKTLQNAVLTNELAHAYLFTGSRGVGKTTVARIVAKASNCPNLKNGDPCGKCEICQSIAQGSAMDVIEIDAASNTGVDNIRELIEHAQFKPASLQTKVFIIDEVHMLSKAAFNALLKTLEEPPSFVRFILATTDIEKVPETIVSRTQKFDFHRISSSDMISALTEILKQQKISLDSKIIEMIVAQSEGSMRDALSKLHMVVSAGDKVSVTEAQRLLGSVSSESVQQILEIIFQHQSELAYQAVQDVVVTGQSVIALNREILITLQKILEHKIVQNSHASIPWFDQFDPQVPVSDILFIVRLFLRSYKEINTSPVPELPVILAVVEACLHNSTGSNTKDSGKPHSTKDENVKSSPKSAHVGQSEVQQKFTSPNKRTSVPAQSLSDANTPELETSLDKTVTKDEVQAWWPEVINLVKKENSPIATLLRNSPLHDVSNGKIVLAVKYLFHKEHLDNKKHQTMISRIITEVTGKHLLIRSVIHKEAQAEEITSTVESINDALKIFGGELVE